MPRDCDRYTWEFEEEDLELEGSPAMSKFQAGPVYL